MEIYAILHLHASTHTTVRVSFATGASEKATNVSFARPAALGHSSLHGRGNDSILICFYFSRKKNSWEANCVHTALSLGSVEVCVPSAGNIHLISHSHEHCHEITFPDHGAQKCRYMGGDVIQHAIIQASIQSKYINLHFLTQTPQKAVYIHTDEHFWILVNLWFHITEIS